MFSDLECWCNTVVWRLRCEPRQLYGWCRRQRDAGSLYANILTATGYVYFFNYYCRLLIFFENSLDHDHAQQNVGSDLDPNCLTLWWYSWKNFSKKVDFKKIIRRHETYKIYLAGKELSSKYIKTNCLTLKVLAKHPIAKDYWVTNKHKTFIGPQKQKNMCIKYMYNVCPLICHVIIKFWNISLGLKPFLVYHSKLSLNFTGGWQHKEIINALQIRKVTLTVLVF